MDNIILVSYTNKNYKEIFNTYCDDFEDEHGTYLRTFISANPYPDQFTSGFSDDDIIFYSQKMEKRIHYPVVIEIAEDEEFDINNLYIGGVLVDETHGTDEGIVEDILYIPTEDAKKYCKEFSPEDWERIVEDYPGDLIDAEVKHTLHAWIEEIYNEKYDAVLTLQPTSPFRTTETIDKCIELMASSDSIDSVITVSNIEGNRPEWMLEVDLNGKVNPYASPFKLHGKPIIKLCARQDFPPMYKINGVVFLTRKKLLKDNILIGFSPSILETSEKEAIDIDTPIDLAFANQIATNKEIN